MNFLKLNTSDFEEFLFDMQGLKEVFENRGDRYEYNFDVPHLNIGTCNFKSERKGDVYLAHFNSFFNQNVLSKTDTYIQNISLFFVKKGNAGYILNDKTKTETMMPSFSNNVYFMTEEPNYEKGFYLKEKEMEVTSLHLSFEYFKKLANLYPELFEKSFLRYEKGETFYLNNNYHRTSSEQYRILNQIENSHLMGTCSNAYVDAKVLELLSLSFSQSIEKQPVFKDYDKIQEASHILISDIFNPPSIRELALKVGINEKKLKQGFKAVFNNTVFGYLFDHKMQLAQQYLQDSTKSIAEIGLLCGYEHPSHFSTAFKRRFGVTPKDWGKKIKSDKTKIIAL